MIVRKDYVYGVEGWCLGIRVCEVECEHMGVGHEGVEDAGKGLYGIGMGVCMEQGMKVWQLM